LAVKGFGQPLHAVFIRAPAITRVWGKAKALARFDELTAKPRPVSPGAGNDRE